MKSNQKKEKEQCMIHNSISKQELKSDLEQFKRSVYQLVELEDQLEEIGMQLNGDTVHSIQFRSQEEAKYQRGNKIYKNNITDLMFQEERLIHQRDYYLYRVKRVEALLRTLNDEQVTLLEYRYWYGYSIRTMEELIPYSKSKISRDLNNIIDQYCE